jgi:hypothetical protein
MLSKKFWKFLFKKSAKDRNEDTLTHFILQNNQTLMKALMHSNNIQRLREQLMKKKCQNGISFVNE